MYLGRNQGEGQELRTPVLDEGIHGFGVSRCGDLTGRSDVETSLENQQNAAFRMNCKKRAGPMQELRSIENREDGDCTVRNSVQIFRSVKRERHMNIAVVDNSAADFRKLENLLNRYASMHRIDLEVRGFQSTESFLSEYRPYQYTLLFLDVYMDGMSGMEAARKIREMDNTVMLVFLTTSREHHAEAFQYYASAYLAKPAEKEMLFRTLDHLLHLHTEKEDQRFVFTSNRHEIRLHYDDIVSIQADGNYVLIIDSRGVTYRTRMLLSDAQRALSGDRRFLNIIRGVIVNLEHVVRISDRTCQLTSGVSLPVSSLKFKEIQQIWHNYSFEKKRRESVWNP